MIVPPRSILHLASACLVLGALAAQGGEPYRFPEAVYEKGELKYINGLPVLTVAGTPEEIGRQEAALISAAARKIEAYPKELIKQLCLEDQWPRLAQMGQGLLPQFPKDHLAELEAFARSSGIQRDLLLTANTIMDWYRGAWGCSSLIVEAQRSATQGPLFGRNLDFFGLGMLHQYNLVVVYRPQNKHAFVSIGFPGLLGCLSGMNDAGLALAVHEVFTAGDSSAIFNPRGTPYAFCFRRILEECTTAEEAESLVRSTERTTLLNLALCDRRGAAVLEITPKTVASRRAVDGICVCTNHFRTEALASFPLCRRYSALAKSRALKELDLAEVARKLDEVNQGQLTLQTMIFEPAGLVLHLAIGSRPSSAEPLKRLPLAPLFGIQGHP